MTEINSGLEGVVVASTKISHVDGQKGQLVYRDYNLQEAIKGCQYEDIAFLLSQGKKPSDEEKISFRKKLASFRFLPDYLKKIMSSLPKDFGCMAALRTAVSSLKIADSVEWPPTLEQGLEVIAKVPSIIAYFHHHAQGTSPIEPDLSLSHTENYLYMLTGHKPDPAFTQALDAYLMIGADHGMNASTFTARVVSSTRSDLISAVTAAIGALKGPLHGGAPSEVDDMLDEIGDLSHVESWVREKIQKGERLMGFGHRIYKTYDPRAAILKEIVKQIPSANNAQLALSLALEKIGVTLLEEYKPGRNLYPNVEFWAAAVLRTVNLPKELYSPTFAAGRMAGWVAHILEQSENNRLIRPSSQYLGNIPPMLSTADSVGAH